MNKYLIENMKALSNLKKCKISSLVFYLLAFFLVSSEEASASMDLGISYGFKTTYFSPGNHEKSDSTSTSLSFSVFDRVALELSYSEQQVERSDKFTVDSEARLTYQKSQFYGGDFIFILLERDRFQPYLKAGVSYFTKNQQMKIGDMTLQKLPEEKGTVPSYGAGFKVLLTEGISLKLSYDIWSTNIVTSEKQDTALKVGISVSL